MRGLLIESRPCVLSIADSQPRAERSQCIRSGCGHPTSWVTAPSRRGVRQILEVPLGLFTAGCRTPLRCACDGRGIRPKVWRTDDRSRHCVVSEVFDALAEARQEVPNEIASSVGPVRQAIYTFGFDDRHGHYTVIAMDQTGNYWVSAQGVAEGGSIPLYGRDDDPVMKSMGLEKEFVIHLTITSPDRITIATRFIDNRTEVRREIPFLEFELRR